MGRSSRPVPGATVAAAHGACNIVGGLALGRPEGPRHARRSGPVTAVTLPAGDVVGVPEGRLRPTYLLDAAVEAASIAARLRRAPAGGGRWTGRRGR
ncbi:hypothetical protein [Streptomyces sp. NPDC052693]|uniref:hypothetical protein n=1 Tax=Streptomyces sp. NPDC052693 TaxID=3155814 RepID=UPI00343DD801